jgi:cytochrome c553
MFSSPVGGVAMAALLLTAASALAAAPRYADLRHVEPIQGDAAAGAKKAAVCFACHGANGASVAPTFPRLAGQRADYLYHRLVSFKRADPKDPYYSVSPMTPNVANLSDTDMRDLATYFSLQTPPATAAAAAPGNGEALFLSPIRHCADSTRRISSHGSRVFARNCRMTPPTTSLWVMWRRPSTMSRFRPSRPGSVR